MLVTRTFFEGSCVELAERLLGTFLVHSTPAGRLIGRVVETEAYLYRDDPACHASRGMTKRNEMMFGRAGLSYVYFIYGMHYCFNVVAGEEGAGEAVLIRAVEPVEGIGTMRELRRTEALRGLCSGPGKLTQAFGIGREQNGLCLRRSPLQLHKPDSFSRLFRGERDFSVVRTTRIGISNGKELPLRFYIKDNAYVSKR